MGPTFIENFQLRVSYFFFLPVIFLYHRLFVTEASMRFLYEGRWMLCRVTIVSHLTANFSLVRRRINTLRVNTKRIVASDQNFQSLFDLES